MFKNTFFDHIIAAIIPFQLFQYPYHVQLLVRSRDGQNLRTCGCEPKRSEKHGAREKIFLIFSLGLETLLPRVLTAFLGLEPLIPLVLTAFLGLEPLFPLVLTVFLELEPLVLTVFLGLEPLLPLVLTAFMGLEPLFPLVLTVFLGLEPMLPLVLLCSWGWNLCFL